MSKQRNADQLEIGAAAAAPAWRSFSFFDPGQVRDPNDFARSPQMLRNPHQVADTALCPVRPPPLAQLSDDLADSSVAGSSSLAAASQSHLRQPALLVGTIEGQIHVLDPDTYAELAIWQAFSSRGIAGRVTHLSCDSRGRLISLGEEDGSRFPVLRIWDMRVGRILDDGKHWTPKLLSEGKVQHGSRPHPVATVAHTASLSFLSVALGDGTVLLIRGLDSTLMSAAASTAGLVSASASASSARPAAAVALPRFKVVYQPAANDSAAHEPVTALGFSETPSTTATQRVGVQLHAARDAQPVPPPQHGSRGRKGPLPRQRPKKLAAAAAGAIDEADAVIGSPDNSPVSVHLFIVTLSRILRYIVVGKGAGSSPATLDDVGCALGCAAVIPSGAGRKSGANLPGGLAGKMVVAREEAIYVIGPEGREACYAYEGPKSSIQLSSSQVVIVTPPFAPSSSSASATVRNFVAGRDSNGASAFTPSSSASRGSPLSNGNGPLQRRGMSEIAKVTVFDLDNKFVAYSGTFDGGVRETWVGPSGEVVVLGDNGSVTRLDEKPLRAKLEILYRKSLFLLAVNLVRSHAERAGTPDTRARVEALMADIFQRYGDHLHNKGDFEGAMAQYVKTIGHTQPSYVIRKFLDAQRITNLTTYLQELHARGMASSDHTTLLLNCYTKLKDVASLDRFIKRPPASMQQAERPGSPAFDGDDGVAADHERDELPFNLETAMRVCRQAGYYGHAAYLAKRYGEHDEYLRIQIEDANDHEDVLAYIRGLPPLEAIRNMTQYSKLLLDQLPQKTTDLLIELCTGAFRSTTAAGAGQATPLKDSAGKSAAAAYLSYLHVGAFNRGTAGAEGGGGGGGGGSGTGSSTPNQIASAASNRNSTAMVEPFNVDGGANPRSRRKSVLPGIEGGTLLPGEAKDEVYTVPSPRLFFAHFIQHPAEFTRFLETVALARWGQSVNMDLHSDSSHDPLSLRADLPTELEVEDEVTLALRELGMSANDDYEDHDDLDQKATWNTLLELYLSSSKATKAGETNAFGLDRAQRNQRREKALHLLEQHSTLPYDVSHALMLCSVENFTEGLVLLYERMGMYEDVLRFWMDASHDQLGHEASEASCKVMAALRRYGGAKPHLYPIVLRYLVSSNEILSRHGDDLRSVLQHIEDHALMSPLEVIQSLSRTGVASVGLVRSYFSRTILREQSDIEANESATASLQLSTAEKLNEVHALTDAERPQVFQMTRCSACGGQLDLPTVHFMCKHSFHQRCLGENETECLVCAQRLGAMRDWRREVEGLRGREDLFEAELQSSKDGFETISTFFSKGLMGLAASAQLS